MIGTIIITLFQVQLIVFVVVVVAYFSIMAYKARKASNLLARLWVVDRAWDSDELKWRLDELRTKIIRALEWGNLAPVKVLMTEGLYEQLKDKTVKEVGLTKPGWGHTVVSALKNVVDVEDYRDNSRDRLGLYVSQVSLRGRGARALPDELWTFVRRGDEWIVGDINPEASIFDLIKSRAYSEPLTISDNMEKWKRQTGR